MPSRGIVPSGRDDPSKVCLLYTSPDRLDAIIAKALVKDRAARYQTATEIHRDLEELKRALDSGRNPLARVHDESAGSHPVAIQKRLAAAFAAGIAVLALLIYFVLKPMTQPHVSGYQQITHDGFMKDGAHTSGNGTNPAMVTDGSRVYFCLLYTSRCV